MVDVPDATKCCFCFPLRRGLLAWVYIKLAILLGVTVTVLGPLTIFVLYYAIYEDHLILSLILVVYAVIVIEIIFELLFIISAHTKKYKYLKLYYRYEIVMLCSETVMSIIFSWFAFIGSEGNTDLVGVVVGGVLFLLSLLALHAYFIYLVRSEVRKLELSAQFTFKNLTDDPECSLQILHPNAKETK